MRALSRWLTLLIGVWVLMAAPVVAQEAPDAGEAEAGAPAEETPDASGVDAPASESDAPKVDAPTAKSDTPDDSTRARPDDPRLSVLAEGDVAQVARLLEVEASRLETAAGITSLIEELKRRAVAEEGALVTLREQRAWLIGFRDDLSPPASPKPAEANPTDSDAKPTDAKPPEPTREEPPKEKPPQDEPPTEDAPGEGGEPASSEPEQPAPDDPALVRVRGQLEAVERRVAVAEAEVRFLEAAVASLERIREGVQSASSEVGVSLSSDATEDIAARVKEDREEVERLREEVERSGERAREELQRAREDQEREEEFDERYREYVTREPVVRAEQLFIIDRLQREIPRLLTETEEGLADVHALKTAVRDRVDECARRIEERDKPEAARSDAHALFLELEARRDRQRARAESLVDLLHVVQRHGRKVRADLVRMRQQSEALQTAARSSEDRGRQKAAAFAVSMLQRLEAYDKLLRLRERLYEQQMALAAEEVSIAKQAQAELIPLLPQEPQGGLWRLSEGNLLAARDELRDLVIEARQLMARRQKQLRQLPGTLMSLAGVGWILQALLLVTAAVLLVRQLRKNREAWLQRAIEWVTQRRNRRSRAQAMATALEALGEAIEPAALLVAVEVVAAALLVEPKPPVAQGVLAVARAVLIYRIVVKGLQAVALPSWFRQMTPARQAQELEHPERGPRLQRNRFLIETARLLVLYTVACQTTLALVRSAMGMFFLGYWIHWLGYLGYAVVIYVLLSRWRQTISTLFARLARGRRAAASVEFVETYKDRAWGLLVIFGAFLYVLARELWNVCRGWLINQAWIRRLSNFLFRRQVELGGKEHAEEVKASVGALPAELRAMFQDDPLRDEPHLVQRPVHARLTEAVAAWRGEARSSAWVVVGEQGMGKTTALNQVWRLVGETAPVRWWDAPQASDPDIFAAELLSWLELDANHEDEEAIVGALLEMAPSVLLLDNAHRLFLRRVGGFGAFERLQRLLVTTGHHHLWVVSVDAYGWALLQRMHNRPLRPPNVIWLDGWGDDDLRRLIDARMAPLGCQVTYEPMGLDDEDAFEDEWSLFDQSAGGYFRLLEESARGNPRSAMRLWQESLVRDEAGIFHVHLFPAPPRKRLMGLTDTDRFLLAALVQHVALTVPALARATSLELSLVSAHLLGLEQLDLVALCPDTGQARVPEPAYNPVVDVLADFNLLHV